MYENVRFCIETTFNLGRKKFQFIRTNRVWITFIMFTQIFFFHASSTSSFPLNMNTCYIPWRKKMMIWTIKWFWATNKRHIECFPIFTSFRTTSFLDFNKHYSLTHNNTFPGSPLDLWILLYLSLLLITYKELIRHEVKNDDL